MKSILPKAQNVVPHPLRIHRPHALALSFHTSTPILCLTRACRHQQNRPPPGKEGGGLSSPGSPTGSQVGKGGSEGESAKELGGGVALRSEVEWREASTRTRKRMA